MSLLLPWVLYLHLFHLYCCKFVDVAAAVGVVVCLHLHFYVIVVYDLLFPLPLYQVFVKFLWMTLDCHVVPLALPDSN